KGIGEFIMASLEYERRATSSLHPAAAADPVPSVKIFDLYGRRCSTAPHGLYIELRDGIATKRVKR
ncbi:MAG: hypothetical protein K2K92_05350, partial [Duncaniella sp.]|nr:hypothetical protein [Duncaniella sp.]